MRSLRLVLLAALASVALGACGDDGEDTGAATTPAGPPVATIEVELTEYRMDPLNPGTEDAGVVDFEVTNAGKIDHALEVEGPEGEVETEEIAPGATATLEADLNKPGSYKWYCPIADHEQRGMVGKIAVGAGPAAEKQQRRDGADGPGSDAHGGY